MKLLMMRLAERCAVVRIKAQVFVGCEALKVVGMKIMVIDAANYALIAVTLKNLITPLRVFQAPTPRS